MNKYNPDIHRRRSIRLCGYDYSQEGLYFLTLCTSYRECLFGETADGEMRLSEIGQVVEKCWLTIPLHYPDTILHNHIVMPNHFHGIIEITKSFDGNNSKNGNTTVGAENFPPLHNCQPRTLGAIVRGFKIGTTKDIGYSVWQRNYHEHIIRNHADYARIADYIASNPANWNTDSLYNPR